MKGFKLTGLMVLAILVLGLSVAIGLANQKESLGPKKASQIESLVVKQGRLEKSGGKYALVVSSKEKYNLDQGNQNLGVYVNMEVLITGELLKGKLFVKSISAVVVDDNLMP